jgi:hypothetical protein
MNNEAPRNDPWTLWRQAKILGPLVYIRQADENLDAVRANPKTPDDLRTLAEKKRQHGWQQPKGYKWNRANPFRFNLGSGNLGPILRAVIDAQDFNNLLLHAIHGDIGQRRKHNLAGVVQLPHSQLPLMGMMLFQVIVDLLQIRCGGWRPADTHLGAKHLFETRVHFFFFDKLAPISLSDAFAHGGAKPVFFFEQAQGGILHQMRGIGPCLGGNLRKLRRLLRGEINFHALHNTGNGPVRQAAAWRVVCRVLKNGVTIEAWNSGGRSGKW